ncbi:MAG: TetR family transcriptional regulator, partial [Mycetocola sp.]
MSESAPENRASQRKQATSSLVTTLCRRLTAERGLSGFTIEEVCADVGISRRTFFNYFPSKEDAVLGADESGEMTRFADDFRARESRGWAAVVDDLVDFAIQHTRAAGHDAAEHIAFMKVLEREPRLLARFIGIGREREQAFVALVAEREGVPLDDPHARAAIDVVSTVMRSTADRISDPRVAADFGGALADTLAAIRAVLTPPPTRK